MKKSLIYAVLLLCLSIAANSQARTIEPKIVQTFTFNVANIISFSKLNHFNYEASIKRRLLNASFTFYDNGSFRFDCYGSDNSFYRNVIGTWYSNAKGIAFEYMINEQNSSVSGKSAMMFGFINANGLMEMNYDYASHLVVGSSYANNLQGVTTRCAYNVRMTIQ